MHVDSVVCDACEDDNEKATMTSMLMLMLMCRVPLLPPLQPPLLLLLLLLLLLVALTSKGCFYGAFAVPKRFWDTRFLVSFD